MYIATANALQRQEFGTIGASTSRVGAFVEEGSPCICTECPWPNWGCVGRCQFCPCSVIQCYLMLFEF